MKTMLSVSKWSLLAVLLEFNYFSAHCFSGVRGGLRIRISELGNHGLLSDCPSGLGPTAPLNGPQLAEQWGSRFGGKKSGAMGQPRWSNRAGLIGQHPLLSA